MSRHPIVQKYARPQLVVAVVVALSLVGAASGGAVKNGKQPPRNTSLPTIAGNATVGGSLSGSAGSWTGPGGSFTYQWVRCDSAGNGCAPIGGATATTYGLSANDAGTTLRFAVTASNQTGTSSATSPASGVVQAATTPTTTRPSNTAPPTVVGTPQAGKAVTASPGTWNGTVPLNYTYGWQRCDATGTGCSTVASGSSYTLTSVDVNNTVRLSVTAQNSAGAVSAESAPSPLVVAAPSIAPTPQPTFPIRAAFYYPWYNEPWTAHYATSFGWYQSADPAVQQAQIRAFEYAHLNAGISSWYAPGDPRDTSLKALLAQTVAMGSPLKWCVYYEREAYETLTPSQIASDLAYIRDNLATSSAYLKVNGKFVVFVYSPGNYSGLDGSGNALVDRYLSANSLIGNAAYIDLKVYNNYQRTPAQPDSWHQYYPAAPESGSAATGNQYFTSSPGFWGPKDATPQLTRDPARWEKNLADMVASKAPWQLVTTFNEWYESSSVESSPSWASPSGYGTYLDALHSAIPVP